MPLSSPRSLRRRSAAGLRSGFTLVEVLITCTLIGLVALMTIPRFTSIEGEQNVSRAAQAVSNDLQLAAGIAQRDRQPIRIRWKTDSLRLTITNRAMTTTYRQIQIGGSNGYSLSSSQISVYPTSNYVEVYPNGLASDSISITFTASTGYSKRVRMTRAGLVQIF